jgi:hypothetical protein
LDAEIKCSECTLVSLASPNKIKTPKPARFFKSLVGFLFIGNEEIMQNPIHISCPVL